MQPCDILVDWSGLRFHFLIFGWPYDSPFDSFVSTFYMGLWNWRPMLQHPGGLWTCGPLVQGISCEVGADAQGDLWADLWQACASFGLVVLNTSALAAKPGAYAVTVTRSYTHRIWSRNVSWCCSWYICNIWETALSVIGKTVGILRTFSCWKLTYICTTWVLTGL